MHIQQQNGGNNDKKTVYHTKYRNCADQRHFNIFDVHLSTRYLNRNRQTQSMATTIQYWKRRRRRKKNRKPSTDDSLFFFLKLSVLVCAALVEIYQTLYSYKSAIQMVTFGLICICIKMLGLQICVPYIFRIIKMKPIDVLAIRACVSANTILQTCCRWMKIK